MEKEEKNVIEQTVDTTVNSNDVLVVESTENKIVEANQDEEQDDNLTIDDNTEISPEPETVEPVVDEPVENPTLAPTDDIIPAPTDIPGETIIPEPVVDPVVVDNPPVDTVIPEDPAALAPAEPVVDVPIVGPGPEAVATDTCDGCAGVDPCACTEPCKSSVTVANFFGTLQECVTIVWRYHLKTRKHHVHVDLNDFYIGALHKVDDIIEQYQGIVGIIEDPFTNCVVGEGKDEITYFQELKTFIETNKCVLGDHSEINSSIDEFLGLIDSTLYKLTSFTESAVKSFEEFVYEDFNESCCHKIPKFSLKDEDDSTEEEEEEE